MIDIISIFGQAQNASKIAKTVEQIEIKNIDTNLMKVDKWLGEVLTLFNMSTPMKN